MYLVAEYMQISAPKARGRCGGNERESCWGKAGSMAGITLEGKPSPGSTQTWRCCRPPPRCSCRARGKCLSRPWCRPPSWWDWWGSRSTPAAQEETSVKVGAAFAGGAHKFTVNSWRAGKSDSGQIQFRAERSHQYLNGNVALFKLGPHYWPI